ncbi:MAG: cell wall hydrolase [Candidatus Limivicinus sp.]
MNMKQLFALLAALLLIYALPVQAMAEEDEAQAAGTEDAGMEEAAGAEPEEATGSIFDLLNGSTVTLELDMAAYYLDVMAMAAVDGDLQAGREAAQYRNEIIDQNGSDQVKISFDDLYLLAKLICAEAGSDWLSDDFRLCVGEVVLNRVESPEFPDSISDVVYQKGQYASAGTAAFASLVPSQACVDAALRLMQGERKMAPSVVFQSDHEQGEIFSMYTDRRLGTTFFCVSPNQELYPIPET